MNVAALVLRPPDPTGLLIWCVLGFVAGIALFFYGFRLLQRRRLILDTPLSKIRSASMGMVEINGLAVGPYTMTAPVSARPCYYYRTLAWEWKQSGKNKQWVRVAAECMHVPFFVDDNTGRVLIDPRGADLDLHCDFEQQFNGAFFSNSDDPPASVLQFLARHGVATTNQLKIAEYCIKPKNSLFVLGTLAENPGVEVRPEPVSDSVPADSFFQQGLSFSLMFPTREDNADLPIGSSVTVLAAPREQRAAEIIRLSSLAGATSADTASTKSTDMSQQQKIAAALLKAGISNPAAWAAAGVQAPEVPIEGALPVQVLADNVPAKVNGNTARVDTAPGAPVGGFDPNPPVVLRKGANHKTFLISWRSQRMIARTLGWKCALMIWGGPALALISLYFFLAIEHLF